MKISYKRVKPYIEISKAEKQAINPDSFRNIHGEKQKNPFSNVLFKKIKPVSFYVQS